MLGDKLKNKRCGVQPPPETAETWNRMKLGRGGAYFKCFLKNRLPCQVSEPKQFNG